MDLLHTALVAIIRGLSVGVVLLGGSLLGYYVALGTKIIKSGIPIESRRHRTAMCLGDVLFAMVLYFGFSYSHPGIQLALVGLVAALAAHLVSLSFLLRRTIRDHKIAKTRG
jgi:hypothetical protein